MTSALDRIPAGHLLLAAACALPRRAAAEWRASSACQLLLAVPRPEGLRAAPKDRRPADPDAGRRILAGGFAFGGETLAVGPRGDPWDRPAPSQRFAASLHGFGWLKDLTAHDDPGAWEALRLTLAWRRLFGRWNRFSWAPQIVERRVFNLACAIRALSAPASEAEAEQVATDLARQARYVLGLAEGPARAAERATAAAVAGAALGGPAGERLLARALRRLDDALAATVTTDGGHASRSPQAALELYFDLSTLDEALSQIGVAPPAAMARSLAQLAEAVRFFTLADGRLAAFQGGGALSPAYVAAARAEDDAGPAPPPPSRNGYHRLEGRALQVVADAAAPAAGPWGVSACGQPLALEVLAGGKRLIVGAGWSPGAEASAALRLVDGGSTLAVADAACGAPLGGFAAEVLGPRLVAAYEVDEARRHEADGAVWLETAHDGWARRFGLRHERRLYLDVATDELRGEDRLVPLSEPGAAEGRRFIPFVVRFHLHPQVSALVAGDRTSVLLKVAGQETGWWLRSDAADAALRASVHQQDGEIRHGQQILLRGQARLDAGARVRWKLSAAHDRASDQMAAAQVDAERASA